VRGLVPASEHTKKEVKTMRKRTIVKWWLSGLVIQVAGGILATVMTFVLAAHVIDLSAGNRNFVPDGLFWTAIAFMIVGGTIICGGSLAQVVAQIGALFNTHHLADRRWFRGLLYSSIAGLAISLVTLGLQLGLGFSGSGAAGLVWPGYVVGGLIGFVLMVSYMIAGPDGMVGQPGESTAGHAAAGTGTEGLAPA
jgi:hypothetical protein